MFFLITQSWVEGFCVVSSIVMEVHGFARQWHVFDVSLSLSGSVFWYFVLLNYVKDEDLSGCSTACASLLTAVSRQLQDRLTPLEALLQTRWAFSPSSVLTPHSGPKETKNNRL